jgi:hypothetical protein
MQDIEKNFVNYELAFKLKELGFNEECFGYYTPIKNWMISTNPKFNSEPHFIGPNWSHSNMTFYFMYKSNSFGDRTETVCNSKFTKAIKNIAVPLYQQVTEWLRNEHNFHIELFNSSYGNWCVTKIVEVKGGGEIQIHGEYFDDYYKALEKGIIECLNLIKIYNENSKR